MGEEVLIHPFIYQFLREPANMLPGLESGSGIEPWASLGPRSPVR